MGNAAHDIHYELLRYLVSATTTPNHIIGEIKLVKKIFETLMMFDVHRSYEVTGPSKFKGRKRVSIFTGQTYSHALGMTFLPPDLPLSTPINTDISIIHGRGRYLNQYC